MPITPFHFGPGALLHAVAPRQVSFIAFCSANVLMDIEPLYFMIARQPPLHRFFHTALGAALVTLAVFLLFRGAHGLDRRILLPNPFDWQGLNRRQVVLGAAAGSYSHIVFDSIMHYDMRPLAPFSDMNPLLALVPLSVLHGFCLLAGIVALCILACRHIAQSWRR